MISTFSTIRGHFSIKLRRRNSTICADLVLDEPLRACLAERLQEQGGGDASVDLHLGEPARRGLCRGRRSRGRWPGSRRSSRSRGREVLADQHGDAVRLLAAGAGRAPDPERPGGAASGDQLGDEITVFARLRRDGRRGRTTTRWWSSPRRHAGGGRRRPRARRGPWRSGSRAEAKPFAAGQGPEPGLGQVGLILQQRDRRAVADQGPNIIEVFDFYRHVFRVMA